MADAAAGPAPKPIERPLQWIVLFLLALLAYVLRPVLAAIALGGFLVLVGWSAFEKLEALLGGRHRLATWIATIVVLLGILVPIVLVGFLTIREAAAGIEWIARALREGGGVQGIARHLPRALQPWVNDLAVRGSSSLGRLATEVAAWTPAVLSTLGLVFAELFLALVTVYYLFGEGRGFVAFVRRVSPLRPSHTETLLAEFREVALGLFWGNAVTALFHGLAGGLGYWICGVPRIFFLGTITMFASFIPAVGTAVIWLPIAIVLIATGHTLGGIGLLLWGVIIIGGIDQVLRPILSKGRMKMPNLLMFLTLFGGVAIFGVKGLLLGPLFGSLAVTGLRLIARERAQASAQRTVTSTPVPDGV